jgi:hypothetical protein
LVIAIISNTYNTTMALIPTINISISPNSNGNVWAALMLEAVYPPGGS